MPGVSRFYQMIAEILQLSFKEVKAQLKDVHSLEIINNVYLLRNDTADSARINTKLNYFTALCLRNQFENTPKTRIQNFNNLIFAKTSKYLGWGRRRSIWAAREDYLRNLCFTLMFPSFPPQSILERNSSFNKEKKKEKLINSY